LNNELGANKGTGNMKRRAHGGTDIKYYNLLLFLFTETE
jgi:hypothetical protein